MINLNLIEGNSSEEIVKEFMRRCVKKLPRKDKTFVVSACERAAELHTGALRKSGEAYISHPCNVAAYLMEYNLDSTTIAAALLHDVIEDTAATKEELKILFGDDVANLVDSVTVFSEKGKKKSIENDNQSILKTLLYAAKKDVRSVIIKLADKLHNLLTIKYLDKERQITFAQECLDIFAPLAERLGMFDIQWQLEDLSFEIVDPQNFKDIKNNLYSHSKNDNEILMLMRKKIEQIIKKSSIKINVEARQKHFYSTYKKIKYRKKSISDIYDRLAIRIICRKEDECYRILGIIHRQEEWKPISNRFKDFIGNPKSNQYRSLHTTIMTNLGRKMEIQIRTWQMHYEAERGIAAHYGYKNSGQSGDEPRLVIFNELRQLEQHEFKPNQIIDYLKNLYFKGSINVYTPKGKKYELPNKSTALDFAYAIHTDIGNRCLYAKSDGRNIPPSGTLKNDHVVEIITSEESHPEVAWLNYVRTPHAYRMINHWLRHNDI